MNSRYHYSRKGYSRLKPFGAYLSSFPQTHRCDPAISFGHLPVGSHPRHSEDLQPLGLAPMQELTLT